MAAVDLRASRTGYLTLDQAAAINASDAALAKFSAGLPKAELHLHIEGTIEPEMVLTIARRNGIALEGADDAERFCAAQRAKRSFRDLQEFLDLYYASCDVLRTEQDFFEICAAYLARAHATGKTHGGYVDSCYHATARECGLTADECVFLARNSLEATFPSPEEKAALVNTLRAYCEGFSA